MKIELENIVPGLREARARERLNRAAAFAGVPWRVLGLLCVHLTPRHRLELQAAGNAFACSGEAGKGDACQFLWRISPDFTRNRFSPRGWIARRRVDRAVSKATLAFAVREIGEYVNGAMQDMPESEAEAADAVQDGDYVHWMASEACYFRRRFGMALAEYMDTPYIVLSQLRRALDVATEPGATFINESDRIVQRWHRDALRARSN